MAISPSIYPDDPDSRHYDPHVFSHVDEKEPEITSSPDDAAWDVHHGPEEGLVMELSNKPSDGGAALPPAPPSGSPPG